MTLQTRSAIVGLLLVLALVVYGTAKYYSPALILYVVEQSLAQKAPSGTSFGQLHDRLHTLLAANTDQRTRMKLLLRISEQLEKVQHLSQEDLDSILPSDKS